MATVYKLTTQDNKTRKGRDNECTWGPGVTHCGTGLGQLCGSGFIHAYLSPELAVLLNPIHADISEPKLWVCKTDIVKNDKNLKVGGVRLTTLKEIPLPEISLRQKTIFAILCSRAAGFANKTWDEWADAYVADAADAANATAYAAANAATAAAYAAARAAADAPYVAARAAADAAYAARAADSAIATARAAANAARADARAADAANAANAANAARADARANAAYAAARAAAAAAYAADAADAARARINFIDIAKQALTYK